MAEYKVTWKTPGNRYKPKSQICQSALSAEAYVDEAMEKGAKEFGIEINRDGLRISREELYEWIKIEKAAI